MKLDSKRIGIIGHQPCIGLHRSGLEPIIHDRILSCEMDTPKLVLGLNSTNKELDLENLYKLHNDYLKSLEKHVEINGVVYKEVDKKVGFSDIELLSISEYYNQPKEYPNIDIVKEFELITNKKSKLSKSVRDYVIKKFNQKYENVN